MFSGLSTGLQADFERIVADHSAAVPVPGNPQNPDAAIAGTTDLLGENERRFRALLDALPAAVYTTDAEGRITFYNCAAAELAGREPSLGDQWCVTWKLYNPDGTPLPHEHCPMAVALKENRPIRDAEAIAERPDGTRVHFMPYPTPLRDEQGRLIGGVNMLVDITHRKEAEERLMLLAREVDHRANNLLAVVQATIQLTKQDTVEGLKTALIGRVSALAHAHALLSDSRWVGADLRRLIDEELAPYLEGGDGRVHATGPDVLLDPQVAQSLAVGLHEFATNAIKHGSLSVPDGQVNIDWRCADRKLILRWTESGGPLVRPPSRRGFGTGSVERMLRHQLRGELRFVWAPSGVVAEIILPLHKADRS